MLFLDSGHQSHAGDAYATSKTRSSSWHVHVHASSPFSWVACCLWPALAYVGPMYVAGLAALYALSLPCTVVSVSALRQARDLPPSSSVADCEHAMHATFTQWITHKLQISLFDHLILENGLVRKEFLWPSNENHFSITQRKYRKVKPLWFVELTCTRVDLMDDLCDFDHRSIASRPALQLFYNVIEMAT